MGYVVTSLSYTLSSTGEVEMIQLNLYDYRYFFSIPTLLATPIYYSSNGYDLMK